MWGEYSIYFNSDLLGALPIKTIDDWTQATAAEADTYHTARGNSLWTGTETVKTQALQRAWDYLRGLSWKSGVFDTELPADVKSAQIVGALAELVDPGILLPELTADNYLTEKGFGNGAILKKYKPGAPAIKKFSAIDALLRPYIYGGGNVEIRRG